MNGEEPHQNERQAILSRLLDAVKQCQVRFGGRSELATDSDSRVSCLCAAWESALHHGLRKSNKAFTAFKHMTEKAGLGKVTDLFSDIKKLESEPVFWNYVKEHLTKHEFQRFVKLKLVNTDCGRGRAWLRASLNEHSLERYMHMLIERDELLGQHYEDWAFLRDAERNSMLPNMAAGLGSILFAITVDRPELNKGHTALNSIHVQNSVDSADVEDKDEEPKPVISSNVSPASAKKREKKKKKKMPNVVSFDDDDTVGTIITRTGSTSSSGPAIPESVAAVLNRTEEPRESGEGAQDDNVFSGDSLDGGTAQAVVVTVQNDDSFPTKERSSSLMGERERSMADDLRRISVPAFSQAFGESPSSLRSSTSDHMSKSSLCSSTDLEQDSSAFLAPVGVDGTVLDIEKEGWDAERKSLIRREHSLSIDSDFAKEGEIQSASLGLKLAQQTIHNSGSLAGVHSNGGALTDATSQDDLKQAVVHMMLRKESVEEQNKKLEGMLQREMDVSSTLRAELEQMKLQHTALHEKDTAHIVALQKENELLKHQLKKYVSAVQMLRTQGAKKEETLGIHLDQPQPSIPPAKQMIDYSHEASEYEKKLIQVAEMHGELMEFNEMLQRQIKNKDALLRQWRDELVQLRGPLPHDRRLSMAPGEDLESLSLQPTLINIWIPSAFLRGSANNTHHVYQVYVRIRDEEWNVYRRYSQFFDMHVRLKKVYPIIGKFEFPPKKAIGKKEAKLVEGRRQVFQSYLRNVINVMLERDEDMANGTTKEKLIFYLPFFNDKADDIKKGKRGNKRAPTVPEGAVGGAVEAGSSRQPYQGL